MKFCLKNPSSADIIRIKVKNDIYHYGIYISDDEVIAYGKASDIFKASKEDVKVISTNIKEFLDGHFLEVVDYSFTEKIKKNKPDKVIKLARERLGEAKYDILNNNCEHFVNECVFNKHISLQADNYKK